MELGDGGGRGLAVAVAEVEPLRPGDLSRDAEGEEVHRRGGVDEGKHSAPGVSNRACARRASLRAKGGIAVALRGPRGMTVTPVRDRARGK